MPSKEQLSARCQFVLINIQSISTDVETQQDNFLKLANAAAQTIKDALHAKGLKSMDELVAICKAELPTEEEKKKFQALIDENKAETGWKSLLPKDLHDGLTMVADFIGSCYALSGASKLKAGLTFDSRIGFSFVSAWGNLSKTTAFEAETHALLRRAALRDVNLIGETLRGLDEIAAARRPGVTQVQQQAARNYAAATRQHNAALEAFEAAEGEIKLIEKKAADAAKMAKGSRRRGLIGLVIGGCILGGVAVYSHYHEKAEEEKLKEALTQLCTARLYASFTRHSAAAFASLTTRIRDIAEDYKSGDHSALETDLHKFQRDMGDLHSQAHSEEEELKMLKEEAASLAVKDSEAKQDTSADPGLDVMKKRHEELMKDDNHAAK
ncbi:hypothetical protein BT96DRAFT_977450 [Gymnopus androsaceus JB14]|uniref:Uncharacterized protein n=1 Tax=Gymnopus androsaceus JB14 TaxID=1447944 RepID=A0A6A4HHE1_9AGAR|nr:hypothetical protein BT96DRAFT_977450 [Gymnopus androsaceus JB14]